MPKPTRRLGRGLNSLISVTDVAQADAVLPDATDAGPGSHADSLTTVKVSQLRPNPSQPRRRFPPDQLESLAASIARTGLVQPIVVRRSGDDIYEIVAGERRWRAAQMAGLSEISAIVREASDEQMLEVALVENIFREDLNAMDRAMAYKRYCDEFSLSADDVAGRLGEDRTTVTNYLRLLDLPSEVKQWVIEGQLTMGHTRCLLSLTGETARIQVAKGSIAKALSVRQLEQLVRDRVAARSAPPAAKQGGKAEKRPLIRELEEAFVRALDTKVDIIESRRKGKGKIVIHYGSLNDFDAISEKLGVETKGL